MAYRDIGTEADFRDALQVLNATGLATRCTGGRIVLKGYVCLHCGADNSFEACKSPKRKRKAQPTRPDQRG